MTQVNDVDDIPLLPGPSEERLPPEHAGDYREHREELLDWLWNEGKDPDQREGYAYATTRHTMAQMDKLYRWVWDREDGYTTEITHDHAHDYMQMVAEEDWTDEHKDNLRKAIKRYFRWRAEQYGDDEWETDLQFSTGASQPRDFLTDEERGKIRKAALRYAMAPTGTELSNANREEAEDFVSQNYSIAKDEITEKDLRLAQSWKFPSLVWTSLDAGLRPIEVARAKTHWVDVGNKALRIPKEESSKNSDNWVVGLRSDTADALEQWLDQRSEIGLYDGEDTLWLTKFGKTYGSQALRRLLKNLCDIAGIEYGDRKMSWYTIRHSVGTYMTREEGLAAAQAQLRHRSEVTTMKYDQTPVEDRIEALERMG